MLIHQIKRTASDYQLSSDRVAELLHLPRQTMVLTDLPIAKGPTFQLDKVLEMKERYNPKDPYPIIGPDMNQGVTCWGLDSFKKFRPLLDDIRAVCIYHRAIDAAIDGYYVKTNDPNDVFSIICPSMVIKDENGKELWLDGLSCGYGGEGPSGSVTVLKELGFNREEITKWCSVSNIVKVFKYEGVVDVICPRGADWDYSSPKGLFIDDDNLLVFNQSLSIQPRFLEFPQSVEFHLDNERELYLTIKDVLGRKMKFSHYDFHHSLGMLDYPQRLGYIKEGINELVEFLDELNFKLTDQEKESIHRLIIQIAEIKDDYRDSWFTKKRKSLAKMFGKLGEELKDWDDF